MRKLLFTLPVCLIFCLKMAAQLQVTPSTQAPFTPENLISNVFLGSGVEVKSIIYSGDKNSVGYFSTATSVIGIERGIVMSSGRVEGGGGAIGAEGTGVQFASTDATSNAFDQDLQDVTTTPIFDCAVYTIEFVPIADTLRFKYVWASEEYPEYPCTPFNDVFGFFISGPKPGGGTYNAENIALVPGTGEPVTITNVRPANPGAANCPAKNAQFYNDNNNSNNQPVYDGFLDVFIAEAIVIPCSTYTIKLAIADAGDQIYDSAVFLEAKSFGTGSLDVEFASVSLDGTITEGCSEGVLTFSLPFSVQNDYPIDFQVFGPATNGIDFQTIPPQLFIPAGDSTFSLPIIAFEDGIPETGDFIAIDVRRDVCNRDTFYIYLRDNNLVSPNLPEDTTICKGASVLLDGTLPIPLPTPPSFTNNTPYTIDPLNTPIFSPINVFGVQPFTLQPGVIRSVCVDISHVFIDDIDLFLVGPDGRFLELTTDNGRNSNNCEACFTPAATIPAQAINDSLKVLFPPLGDVPGTFTNTIFKGDWAPEGFWADLWDGSGPTNGTWKLLMRDDFQGFIGKLNDWTITFEASYKITYQWSPGAGLSCVNCPITLATPTLSTTYHLFATDSYGCVVEDSVAIEVLEELAAPVVFCAAQSSNSILFEWSPVNGATGYEVNVNGQGWQPANFSDVQHLVSGLAPSTTVTIEVRGIGACPAATTTHECTNCEVPTANFTTTPATCSGNMDGAITLVATGQFPPFAYEIGAFGNQDGIFTGLAAGNYVATVTDNSGCAANIPFQITEPEAVKVVIQISQNASCSGGNDGQAIANPGGGTAPFSFLWNDPQGQTGPLASGLLAGQIQVLAIDANGCMASDDAQVLEPQLISVMMTTQPVDCFGNLTGTATASPNGGTAPFSFAWNDPNSQNTPTADGLAAQNFTVVVTDSKGCTGIGSIQVNEPPAISATAIIGQTSCNSSPDGTATILPTGGTPTPSGSYFYKWSGLPNQTDSTATGLQPILYSVTISDASGCEFVLPVDVSAPPVLNVSLITISTNCFNSTDGQITATPNGGSPIYTFKWSDPLGQTTQTATGLAAGNYTCTLTDSKGCTAKNSVDVFSPAQILATATPSDAACFGGSTGSVNLGFTGGQSPFSFFWSSGQTTQNIQNQPVGLFSVTLTDGKGCTATVSNIEIGQPEIIEISTTWDDVNCFGGADGKIGTTITGGTSPFAWKWSGPGGFTSFNQNLTNLPTGDFNLTLTDFNGCSVTQSTLIGEPQTAVSANLPPIFDIICFGETSGAATILPTGGTAPWTVLWSNGATTETITDLPTGNYSVTVTDAANCTAVGQTSIGEKGEITADIQISQPLCENGADGSASVTAIFYGNVAAPVADFVIKWNSSPPQTGPTATGLKAGQTYQISILDADGCTAEQSISLINPSPMTAQIDSKTNPKCFGETTGSASASATGGTLPYSFLWSQNAGSQQVASATDLPAGHFFVTITDQNGCFATTDLTLAQPPELDLIFEKINVKCHGESTGKAEATAAGGTAPFSFLWANGSALPRADDLPGGPIFCTLTDANGCTLVDKTDINQPEFPLSLNADGGAVRCQGGHDGSLQIDAAGGTSPYLYGLDGVKWNGSPLQIGLSPGEYTAHVLDANGCQANQPGIEIDDRNALEIDLGPDLTIFLGQNFQLNLTITGAIEPVEIIWDATDTAWLSCTNCPNPTVDSLFYQQTFEVLVIDSTGCAASDFVTVIVEKPRRVFVPTGFSPNDDTQNDRLLVHGQEGVRVLEFKIFDRWGELLFQANNFAINDTANGWDGLFRGDELDPGLFIWTLEVEYIDHTTEFFKGQTMLIR